METFHLAVVFVLAFTAATCNPHRSLTVLSDFNNQEDKQFFATTYPWIVENIGRNLRVKYFFNNTDEATHKRYCTLKQLRINQQADFLKCEAENEDISHCTDNVHLRKRKFERCLKRKVHRIEKKAEKAFKQYKPDTTPYIVLRKGEVCERQPSPKKMLDCICIGSFKKYAPRGCYNPSPEPTTTTPQPSTAETSPEVTTGSPSTPDNPTSPETPPTQENPSSPDTPSTQENPSSSENPTSDSDSTPENPSTSDSQTSDDNPTSSDDSSTSGDSSPTEQSKNETTQSDTPSDQGSSDPSEPDNSTNGDNSEPATDESSDN